MRFETSQHMKLGQQMKLAPRMIQSMEILQMPLAELQERIEQELASNPTLELVELEADPDARPRDEDASAAAELDIGESSAHDFERLDDFEAAHPDAAENAYSAAKADRFDEYREGSYAPSRMAGERDGKLDAMASTPARSASLTEQLLDQWRLVDVDGRTRTLGEQLIAFLDEDGYLRTPFEEIADKMPRQIASLEPSDADWELALQAAQMLLEPAGVVARDARECLLLQLDALQERSEDDGPPIGSREAIGSARRLVAEFFDDLMKNRLPKIAAKSGLDLDAINGAIDVMRRLSLAPARRLIDDAPQRIIPDAIVEYDDDADRYYAYLNETRLPNLQVSREYARMSRDRDVPKGDRDFLKKNLSNAQWLLDAVGQRRHTLLRVINAVLDEQRDYFDYGPEALKPLPMKTVADRLGIHVATVSRAVADKYLETPRGVVALRGFFTGGLSTESGEDVSAAAVKAALTEIVENEDKAKPLSDEALVKALKERGIEIARRTIAKYRGQLDIPPARMRKQFAG